MKNIMQGISMLSLIVSAAFAVNNTVAGSPSVYKKITILDNGIKRRKYILQSNTGNQRRSQSVDYNATQPISTKGIIVAFEAGKTVNVVRFASIYGLKFKKKLATGHYIFENISSEDDTVIIARILQNEKGLKTLKPNWKKNNRPR